MITYLGLTISYLSESAVIMEALSAIVWLVSNIVYDLYKWETVGFSVQGHHILAQGQTY